MTGGPLVVPAPCPGRPSFPVHALKSPCPRPGAPPGGGGVQAQTSQTDVCHQIPGLC